MQYSKMRIRSMAQKMLIILVFALLFVFALISCSKHPSWYKECRTYSTKSYTESIECYENALSKRKHLSSLRKSWVYENIAENWEKLRNFEKTIEYYTKSLNVAEGNVRKYLVANYRGKAYLEFGYFDKAISDFKKANEYHVNEYKREDAYPYFLISKAYLKKGDLFKSIENQKVSEKLHCSCDFSMHYYDIASEFERRGQIGHALKMMDKATFYSNWIGNCKGGCPDYVVEIKRLKEKAKLAKDKTHSPFRTTKLSPNSTISTPNLKILERGKGYIVGRVYINMDGFQNIYRTIIESSDVVIASIKGNKLRKINTKTDSEGYFFLENQPMNERYFPYSIKPSVFNIHALSAVANLDPSDKELRTILKDFSSNQDTQYPIIDCGETIILMKPKGVLATEFYYNKDNIGLDFSKSKPYHYKEGDYGYAGLEHYARSGLRSLGRIAKNALQDRQAFARAEPLKKVADDLKKHDKNAAVEKYRAAIRVYPAYDDAYTALASVLKKQNKKEEAIQILKEALHKCPASNDVKFELAHLYVDAAQAAKAITILESLLQKNSGDLAVYENLAKAYHAADRLNDADRLWQNAISSVKSENSFQEAAGFYMEIGQFDKAIPLYEKYLSAKPKDRWAHKYLADAYVASGNISKAEILWKQGLTKIEDDAKYMNIGDFYNETDQVIKAIPYYEKYLQAKPSNRWAFEHLATAYLAVDRYTDGDAIWQRGLREVDDDDKFYGAAKFYQKAGKNNKALSLFQQYERAKPDDNWAKIGILRSYIANGEVSNAIQTASRGKKALIYWNAYRALMAYHQYDQAEKMLRKTLATHSDGTLSIEKSTIEDRIANLPIEKKAAQLFVAYLKAIQDDGDYENWKGKPYDLYVKRNPLVK